MHKSNELLRRKMREIGEGWRKTADQMDKAGYAALDVFTAAERVIEAIDAGNTIMDKPLGDALAGLTEAEDKALKAWYAVAAPEKTPMPHGSWASMSLEDRIELALRVHAEADRPFDFLPQAEKHAKVGEAKYRELRVKGFSEAAKAARAAVIKSVIQEY